MDHHLSKFPRPLNDNGRGVHGPPGPDPKGFLTDWDFWKEQFLEMDIKWVKMLDPGDGLALPLAEKLIGIGIMPVVRFYEGERYPDMAKADREIKTAKDYVSIGVSYFEIGNEPDLALEWKDGRRPDDWLDIVVDNFIAHADMVRDAGGYLLFPAFGPGGRGNPFQMVVDRGRRDVLDGNCCLAIHNYCLARPLDYPNDPVNTKGQPITEQEWFAEASDKKARPDRPSGPMWAWEMGREAVNDFRARLANPNADVMEDSTCFRAFEYFNALVNEAVGHSIPIFTTEGGYNVGQRAGTTFGDDPRWPKPSPQRVAEMTKEMFDRVSTGPDYYFACMPWLVAVRSMGYGQPNFEHQGPWYTPIYEPEWNGCDGGPRGDEMPVARVLKANPGLEKGDRRLTMRRPGIWAVNGTASQKDLENMRRMNPGAITCFHQHLGTAGNRVFDWKRDNPEGIVVVRFQHPQNWRDDPVGSAVRYGREIAGKWPEIAPLDPLVYFGNEMNLYYENGDNDIGNQWMYETPQFYQKLADWVRTVAHEVKLHAPEMRLVAPPFAFGHHEDGAPENGVLTEDWAGYDYFWQTVHEYFDDTICFHAYWPSDSGGENLDRLHNPRLQDWYAFRWRKVLELFARRYGVEAKVVIDEAGNMQSSSPTFTDQVIWYSRECLKDPRVVCLTWFLYRDPTNSPGNVINAWVSGIADLGAHLNRLAAEPATEPARTVRILLEDGKPMNLPLEEYLRGVVPSEMPPSWPAEALKAQAEAARSYAQHATTHPRHGDAHLCATQHCQVWDSTRKRAETGRAVAETEGIVITYAGEVANALYSANCGGNTVGNEEAFGSAPVPYLRAQTCPEGGEVRGHRVGLCQEGARNLAEQGWSCERIIKHYYAGVELTALDGSSTPSPPAPGPEPEPEPEPSTYEWVASFEYVPGSPVVVGDWPQGPGVVLSLDGPNGYHKEARSGEKAEHGPGGFEVYATGGLGDYELSGAGLSFTIPVIGGSTNVTFSEVTPEPVPEPEPEPTPEPEPEPVPDGRFERLRARLVEIKEEIGQLLDESESWEE